MSSFFVIIEWPGCLMISYETKLRNLSRFFYDIYKVIIISPLYDSVILFHLIWPRNNLKKKIMFFVCTPFSSYTNFNEFQCLSLTSPTTTTVGSRYRTQCAAVNINVRDIIVSWSSNPSYWYSQGQPGKYRQKQLQLDCWSILTFTKSQTFLHDFTIDGFSPGGDTVPLIPPSILDSIQSLDFSQFS